MSNDIEVIGREVVPMPVLLYGSASGDETQAARRRLEELRISFVEINIDEDENAAKYVEEINHGKRKTPVVVMGDHSIVLVNPSQAELDRSLKEAGYPLDER